MYRWHSKISARSSVNGIPDKEDKLFATASSTFLETNIWDFWIFTFCPELDQNIFRKRMNWSCMMDSSANITISSTKSKCDMRGSFLESWIYFQEPGLITWQIMWLNFSIQSTKMYVDIESPYLISLPGLIHSIVSPFQKIDSLGDSIQRIMFLVQSWWRPASASVSRIKSQESLS